MNQYLCKACGDGNLKLIERKRDCCIEHLYECENCGASPKFAKDYQNICITEERKHV